MDKVVYILGAGFSAPLGIPTMSNFLIKSKDLYFRDTVQYKHFDNVFELINKFSATKNYYNTDLFNIEEILSILEMNDFVVGEKLKDDFTAYIKDVIHGYTPEYPNMEPKYANWQDWLFGRDPLHSNYGYFTASILGLTFKKEKSNTIQTGRQFDFLVHQKPSTKYAVLSLNYDLVLENVLEAITNEFYSENKIAFNKTKYDSTWESTHLAKLHGCLSGDEIVPPTWAKGTHSSIAPVWQNAFKILRDANHIRFLGYSLPTSDSYLKYLLKASVIESPHLKTIDVICLDSDNSTESRYRDFVSFMNFRFKNSSITDYLSALARDTTHKARNTKRQDFVATPCLESIHTSFMDSTL